MTGRGPVRMTVDSSMGRGQIVLLGQLSEVVAHFDGALVWVIPVALLCGAVLLYLDLSRDRDRKP